MTTIAQQVATRFGDDGLRWADAAGTRLEEVCDELGSRTRNDSRGADRIEFHDGSALIMAGGAWDLQHPRCSCGYCWEGSDDLMCERAE